MKTLIKTLCALCVLLAAATAPALAELPDITITNVTLNSVCKVVVTMQNLGPGSMPASAFIAGSSPLLAIDVDGVQKSYGQYGDPNHALEHPGGTLNSHPSPLVLGQHTITARYDPTNMLNEANEGNNTLTQVLTGNCPQLQPDLALNQVRFMPDCRAVLELRNAGSAPLQDSAFLVSGVKVRRTIDGLQKGYITLKDMDPGRVLQPPGGTLTWQDFPEFIGQTNVRYEIDPLANETNTANNLKVMTIPPNCGTKTLQKIAPVVIPGALQKPLPTKTTTSPAAPTTPTAPSSLKTLKPVVPTKLPVPPPQPVDKEMLTK